VAEEMDAVPLKPRRLESDEEEPIAVLKSEADGAISAAPLRYDKGLFDAALARVKLEFLRSQSNVIR
jgi:hypothetical protein